MEEIKKMNIQEKLLKAQIELKAPKGQYNSFGKYKYRSCEDILEAVKPVLEKYRLTLKISDELVYLGDRYYVKATAMLIDLDSQEDIGNTAYAREEETKKGMDGSQITGTASSYARKYALNGLFCIDDTKDADTDEYENQNDTQTKEINLTLEEAKDYEITFGKKHPNEKLGDIIEKDKGYLDWLLENPRTDEVIKYAIKLIYVDKGIEILNEEEQEEKLTLMAKINTLIIETNTDLEKLLKHYKVSSSAEMTIEQLKDAVQKLENKGK